MPYELKTEDIYNLASAVSAETHQKGDELFFRYCPYCNGGDRNDRDTFSINLKTGTFNCFRSSCGKHGHFVELARDMNFDIGLSDGYRKQYRKLPQKQITSTDRAVEWMETRGIGAEVVRRYKITTRKDNPSILVFPFYDDQKQMVFIKYRNTRFNPERDKNKEFTEKGTKPILFGMDQCDGFDRLIITEGQIDSLSVAESGINNAVSVPTGALGFTWLDNCWDWVTKFQEVVVFGDCEGGKITLLDTLQKRLTGQKIKAVHIEDYLGEKDANDILRKYGKDAVKKAVENASVVPVAKIKELADVEAVDIYSLPRVFTNIPEIDRMIGGLYFGQVILLTGKRGDGKSTFMGQLIVEAIDQGFSVLAYSGELADYHFKRWIDLQCAGPDHIETVTNVYGDENYRISADTIKQINSWYRGKAYVYDNNAVDDEMDDLLVTIERAVCRYGVKLVCIDNLMTAMDIGMTDDIYRAQSQFVKRLKKVAAKYDIAVILVAHPRKQGGGSNQIENDDIAGSADITNRVDVVLSYSRNGEKEKDESQCDSKLSVLKNRLTGKLTQKGSEIQLYYSQKSKRIGSLTSGVKSYGWEKPQKIIESEWETIE